MQRLISAQAHQVVEIARQAGQEILRIYRSPNHGVTHKADDSPLTLADTLAHELILAGLGAISRAPVVSEEDSAPRVGNLAGQEFWLVDPLDGTRNFVERNDHFVVSIALVTPEQPLLGVIYSPVFDELYLATRGQGAFFNGARITNARANMSQLHAVASGHHASVWAQKFYDAAGITDIRRYGSALKLGRLARGDADLYPRFGPTYEWDIAAGHAILNECGCSVLNFQTWAAMSYNKPDFLNEGFVALRSDLAPQLKPIFMSAQPRPKVYP